MGQKRHIQQEILKFILFLFFFLNHIFMKRHIPNLITSLNLAAGFFSIIYTFYGDLTTASWLILAAMIFDFFDGLSARVLKAYSEIGKELDSLADVVSFGVAPAMIIFQLLCEMLSEPFPVSFTGSGIKTALLVFSPVIMPVCAALRLAIFNTDVSQATSFKGLPTPASALAVISLIFARQYSDHDFMAFLTGSAALLIIFTIILSLLMVSRIPLFSLKTSHFRFKGNEGRYMLVFLTAAALLLFGFGAAPMIIPLYIISSLVSLVFPQEKR